MCHIKNIKTCKIARRSMFCWQKLHRWISNMVLQPTSMVNFSAKLIEIVKWFWFTCEGTFMTMENEHKTKLIFLKQCMPKGTDWFCIVCRVKILNYLKHIPVTRSSFATNSAQFQFYGSVEQNTLYARRKGRYTGKS